MAAAVQRAAVHTATACWTLLLVVFSTGVRMYQYSSQQTVTNDLSEFILISCLTQMWLMSSLSWLQPHAAVHVERIHSKSSNIWKWKLTAYQLCFIWKLTINIVNIHTHTHPFNGPFPGLPRWAGTRKVKPIWIYWTKRQWVAVESAGPCASLHLAPGR